MANQKKCPTAGDDSWLVLDITFREAEETTEAVLLEDPTETDSIVLPNEPIEIGNIVLPKELVKASNFVPRAVQPVIEDQPATTAATLPATVLTATPPTTTLIATPPTATLIATPSTTTLIATSPTAKTFFFAEPTEGLPNSIPDAATTRNPERNIIQEPIGVNSVWPEDTHYNAVDTTCLSPREDWFCLQKLLHVLANNATRSNLLYVAVVLTEKLAHREGTALVESFLTIQDLTADSAKHFAWHWTVGGYDGLEEKHHMTACSHDKSDGCLAFLANYLHDDEMPWCRCASHHGSGKSCRVEHMCCCGPYFFFNV